MANRYPAVCDHAELTAAEALAVKEAGRVENLKGLLHRQISGLLQTQPTISSGDQLGSRSEEAENLIICIDARYPALCKRALLTPLQVKELAAAEAKAASAQPGAARQAPTRTVGGGGCEAGHWIESVSGDGKIVKLEDGGWIEAGRRGRRRARRRRRWSP
jgi:septal ring-binding cell division protein DamX